MVRSALPISLFATMLLARGVEAGEPGVGAAAPTVEPQKWFNAKTNTSWDKLKGRVILVELWATT